MVYCSQHCYIIFCPVTDIESSYFIFSANFCVFSTLVESSYVMVKVNRDTRPSRLRESRPDLDLADASDWPACGLAAAHKHTLVYKLFPFSLFTTAWPVTCIVACPWPLCSIQPEGHWERMQGYWLTSSCSAKTGTSREMLHIKLACFTVKKHNFWRLYKKYYHKRLYQKKIKIAFE